MRYFLMAVFSWAISFFLMSLMRRAAFHVNAVSVPGGRHIHKKVIPMFGGIAIYLSFLMCLMIFNVDFTQIIALIMASIIIIILGILDDINPIRARYKFFVQILVAAIIVFYGNMHINENYFNINPYVSNAINIFLSMFWILSVINALNLVDGLNGLSSGVAIIYFFTVFVIAILSENVYELQAELSIIMFGATLGFWFWNFPRAKIFMGDAGATLLGLIIAIIPFLDFKRVTVISLVLPMMMLVIPTLDIIFTVFRRAIRFQKLSTADNDHIHHRILKSTNNRVKTVLIIYLISAISAASAFIYTLVSEKVGIIIFVAVLVTSLVFIERSKNLTNDVSIVKLMKSIWNHKRDEEQ